MKEIAQAAVSKLEEIQQLWRELGKTKVHTPEYSILMEQIRVQSREYEALVNPSKKD
jgi:hypothetical protein